MDFFLFVRLRRQVILLSFDTKQERLPKLGFLSATCNTQYQACIRPSLHAPYMLLPKYADA